jgi:hypothetical protein
MTSLLLGGALLLMLLIGAAVGLYLTQVDQDIRQQAIIETPYDTDVDDSSCASGFHMIDGRCLHESCRKNSNGNIVCGYVSGEDYCTTDSMGGDRCINESGQSVPCAELGLLRCQCSPGSQNGWWVIGAADSCNELCDDAQIDCSDCDEPRDGPPPNNPQPTPTPTTPPGSTPTPTPTTPPGSTPTPTPTPTPIVGPQCHDIQIYDPNNGSPIALSGDDDSGFVPGETTVNFVCSANTALTTGYHYEFRIWEPCGSSNHDTPLELTSNSWGINYDIQQAGDYSVQCAVCLDGGTSADCDWEAYTPTTCN